MALLSSLYQLLLAFFQFPSFMSELVKIVRKTPQEKHQELLSRIRVEAQQYEDTGRPSWD